MDAEPPPRRESGDDRRLEIAVAARALIVEKGFEGLRTRDIAKRVGINIATLHYHVPSKETLVGLVAQSMAEEFRAQSQKRPRAGLSPLQLLRLEIADFRESVVETPELILVFAELLMRAKRDENVARHIAPMHEFWLGQIRDILEQGRRDGSFRADLDANASAHLITGGLKAACRNPLEIFDQIAAEIERSVANPQLSHMPKP